MPEWAEIAPDAAPDPQNEIFNGVERRVTLAAAVNEVVAFQLVVRSDRPAEFRGVVLDDLRLGDNIIGADQITLYRQVHVSVDDYPAWYLRLTPELRRKRWFADVLVPLTAPRGALPVDLEPGLCEVLWCEIRVPPGTQAGLYHTQIKLVPGKGNAETLAVALEVWPFALSQSWHLPVLAGVDIGQLLRHHLEIDGRPYAPAHLTFDDPAFVRATTILDATFRLLHDHQCSPMPRDLEPIRRVVAGGKVALDWADYDRLISGVVDGSAFENRQEAPAWPLPVSERRPPPQTYGGWGSQAYGRMLVEYLGQCVQHSAERGWLNRQFAWVPVPGTTAAERYRQFAWLAERLRAADARLRVVCELPPYPMAPYGRRLEGYQDITALADIWAVPASLADPDELTRHKAAGKQLWLNPDRPPFAGSLSMIAPAVDARSLAWQAHRFAAEAIVLPAINNWRSDGEPAATGSEGCLLWPGRIYGLAVPVPSVRLKRLRRGLQDVEYLWLLERNRRPGIAATIAADLFPLGGTRSYGEHMLDGRPNGWIADPTAWSLARRLMARELIAVMEAGDTAGAVDEAGEIERFEQQMEWARLIQAVRSVQMDIEGIRALPPSEGTGSGVPLEATVSIYNGTRSAVSGRFEIVEPAEGWSMAPATEPVTSLAPATRLRRTLRMQADAVRPSIEGMLPVSLRLTAEAGAPPSATTRFCGIVSRKLTLPLVIDGRLDDWPKGAGNVAGDFLLVGATDVPKRGRSSPDRPSQPTTVFVTHDAEALYLAFACTDDRLGDRRIARDNYVRYDELWPTDDDLIEVLFDPTGQAVGVSDLYHIVVKSNGAVVAERGVPCLEEVARHEHWPAPVIAAVDDSMLPDRWTIEIRIPLNSLDRPATMWGINFGRYLPRLGEYASWSGARRHLYSPTTLGNLQIVP